METSKLKAKIKRVKRDKRINNIFDRHEKLKHKILTSVKVDMKHKGTVNSFIKMKVKGKKLKKLQSVCKNWKNKELKLFYVYKRG